MWSATSRPTVQDALWRHTLYRSTSSWVFIVPCARQTMNTVPRDCFTVLMLPSKQLDDAAFRCWQPLDIQLHNVQLESPGQHCWGGVFVAVWPGFIGIRSAGGIFGFPRLVYSLRYSWGGQRGCRLPSSTAITSIGWDHVCWRHMCIMCAKEEERLKSLVPIILQARPVCWFIWGHALFIVLASSVITTVGCTRGPGTLEPGSSGLSQA